MAILLHVFSLWLILCAPILVPAEELSIGISAAVNATSRGFGIEPYGGTMACLEPVN